MSEKNFAKLYEIIADEAVMGFVTFDIKTHECIYANKMARQLLELPFEGEVDFLKLDKLYPQKSSSDGKINPMNSDILMLEGFFQDILISKSNGRLFIANLGIKRVESENANDQLLLMLQDMTIQKKLQKDITAKQQEIKNAYEELLEQNQQLKDLDVAKNRFIALTTHELRTPLSAMVASSEMLQMKLYDDDIQHDEFVSMIYDEGNHLLTLVNDILDFSKIQAGKMDFYLTQQDLSQLVEQDVETLHSMAEASEVTLELKKPEEPLLCYYDDIRLKQVLSNIINNAIKYNKLGGNVNVWIEQQDTNYVVYVKDTGKGIPKEQVDQVFNEFETLGKVALHSKGTGLGMPISKRLIEGMGGTINLESEVGVGTTFWITVPIEKTMDDELYRDRPDMEADLLAS